jgi:hypothetical protein
MKKLFLFLLLTSSVLSAQSSVGLCPEGTKPVMSVSDPGYNGIGGGFRGNISAGEIAARLT